MRKQMLITVASAALIAGMAGASAQAPEKGNADRGAPTKMQEAPKADQKAEQQKAAPAKAAAEKAPEAPKSAQSSDKAAPAPKAAQEMDKSKAPSGATAQGSDKNSPAPASKSQAQDKAGAPAPAAQAPAAQGSGQTTGQGVAPAGRAGAAVQLDVSQRTQMRQLILKDSSAPRVTNVNFSLSVGTKVPRERVQLRPLSTQIIEIVPAYRGYLYFLVGNDIVIVEPSTYEIVAVISA